MTEKSATDKTAAAALPEVGYYTDANGLTWQLSAADAAKLGYTAPNDAAPHTPPKPVGPRAAGPVRLTSAPSI